MTGSDSGQNEITAFKLRPTLTAVSPGAHSSKVTFDIANAGALQPIFEIRPNAFTVQSAVNFYTNGKSVTSPNAVGIEMRTNGDMVVVTQDTPCAYFNLKGADGTVITIEKNGVAQGGITCNAGVVAIAGACLSHPI